MCGGPKVDSGATQLGTWDFGHEILTISIAPGQGPEKGPSSLRGRPHWLLQPSNQHVGPTCVPLSVFARRWRGVIGYHPPFPAEGWRAKGILLSESLSCKITFHLRQLRVRHQLRCIPTLSSKPPSSSRKS